MKKLSYIIILAVMFIMTINTYYVQAVNKIDPDDYEPTGIGSSDIQSVTNKVNPIIGMIKTVGMVIAVVTLMVIGIKYMTGSIEAKAEYKKTMIPYVVGVILIVSITQLVGLIADIVESIS